MRGGERVLEALCRLFPDADIFTLFYDPQNVSDPIRSHRVSASFLNPLRRVYRHTLPLMPLALEQFDLRGYDLVISSESGPAKGVLVSAQSRHVCYCHSPMRYLWELYPAYMQQWVGGAFKRALFAPVASYLRLWDYSTAARVDQFIANSDNVRRRIARAYHRQAEVIYPPVPVGSFYSKPAGDYFLVVSALVAYKQLDYAIRYFSRTGRRLKVVGEGPEARALKSIAGSNVEFLGRVSEPGLRELYAGCRALLIPGEEDFGMVAVEALASGKPVVGLAAGGVLEVVSGPADGGFLYPHPGEQHLETALAEFEKGEAEVQPEALRCSARRFSEQAFASAMRSALGI